MSPVKDEVLKFEQPQLVKFRLQNLTDKQMNLQIELRDGAYKQECLVTACEPALIGLLEPYKFIDVTLHLFPKDCGVVNVSGLVIQDHAKKKVHDFHTSPFGKFTVQY